MGVLTGAGCLSRVLGPAAVSLLYARRGPALTFSLTAALVAVAALALWLASPRLAPPVPASSPAPADVELRPLSADRDRAERPTDNV